MTDKPFNITQPNSEQMWACLQRCLSFEDPSSRWERLQNLVTKQLRDESLKAKDVPDWPLPYQDFLFSMLYGFVEDEPRFTQASRLLNITLALADIDRFAPIAFDSWRIGLPKTSQNKELARFFPKISDNQDVAELAKRLGLNDSQTLWLQHSARAVPDWSQLLSISTTSGDMRPGFLSNVLNAFMNLMPTVDRPAVYLQAREIFYALLAEHRPELPGSFLPDLILLVEGETESILLPHFARLLGHDFNSRGVMLQSAGGAKQVARRYFELRDLVTLPIVLLVDADAGEDIEVASESLRENDRLHIWHAGEIEDTFDAGTLVQQLNIFLQSSGVTGAVSPNDFPAEHRRTLILNRLWRARGLGNFDKIGFAEVIVGNLKDQNQVPIDVRKALKTVEELVQAAKREAKDAANEQRRK